MHDDASPDEPHDAIDVDAPIASSNYPDDDARKLARIVGARIHSLRRARGLSLKTLWQRGAPTPTVISWIERGLSNVKIETLQTIAQALDVATFQLFYDEQNDEQNDALYIAANVNVSTAKRINFLVDYEGTGIEEGEGIV